MTAASTPSIHCGICPSRSGIVTIKDSRSNIYKSVTSPDNKRIHSSQLIRLLPVHDVRGFVRCTASADRSRFSCVRYASNFERYSLAANCCGKCSMIFKSEAATLSWFRTTSACFAFILAVNSSSAENLHERWISHTMSAGCFMLLPELRFVTLAPAGQRRRSLPTIPDRLSFDYPNHCPLEGQSAHSEKLI